jgi:hypothetical protein
VCVCVGVLREVGVCMCVRACSLAYPACSAYRHIILSFVASLVPSHFSALSHKRLDLGGGGTVIKHKMCFDFLYKFYLKHFSF